MPKLKKFSFKISENVMFANDEKRKYIHLTVCLHCNFLSTIYLQSQRNSDSQIFRLNIFPLIDELQKIHELEPKLARIKQ